MSATLLLLAVAAVVSASSRGRGGHSVPISSILTLGETTSRPVAAPASGRSHVSSHVTLSNLRLPTDTAGAPLVTGETAVLEHGGVYYFYVNDWGTCAGIDCCGSSGGCASCCYVPSPATGPYHDECVFAKNHSIRVYSTTDLSAWTHHGVVLSPADRPAGIEFRPHVIYNPRTEKFIMWFEDRPEAIVSSGYSVATSATPMGPFKTVRTAMAMADVPGDFDLLIDDDGSCYHVQTTTNDPNATDGFAVTLLDDTYTAPASPRKTATFEAPLPAEGPVFFKRGPGDFYILGGTTCCACVGGSSIYVFRAPHPLGPWRFVHDVGSAAQPYQKHSPTNYVTHAQASTVFRFGDQYVWLGNQWGNPGRRWNADLLYWNVLDFGSSGDVEQFIWRPNVTIGVGRSSKPSTPA